MGCCSGRLMSSASGQQLFYEVCSVVKCSFDELVGEKVVSLSYSSGILAPPPRWILNHWITREVHEVLIQRRTFSPPETLRKYILLQEHLRFLNV